MTAQKSKHPNAHAAVRPLQETATTRRSFINELNFTYRRLLRLLPALTRRVGPVPLGAVLDHQHAVDASIADDLGHLAAQHGRAPEPCECAEANALVENLYHADRAATTPAGRTAAIVRALKSVRTFLIRAWGGLINTLSPETQPAYLQEARELQRREAELHRELVVLGRSGEESSTSSDDEKP